MYMQGVRQSRNMMIQMGVALLLLAALGGYSFDLLHSIYFSNQQTVSGYVLNGMIVALFLLAMARIVVLLIAYDGEERALAEFESNLDQQHPNPLSGLSPRTMIAVRFQIMESMHRQHASIHHQALASTLVAHESTRMGLVRFIHNILILCGVLGTIISLSIALLGASTLLQDAVSSSGMGMVIHGMSTALSTTMTAVVCYLVITYFLSALQGVQTRILAGVEQLTTTRLMPRYQTAESVVNTHALELVKEAHALLDTLNDKVSSLDISSLQSGMATALEVSRQQHEATLEALRSVTSILQDGFRLPRD